MKHLLLSLLTLCCTAVAMAQPFTPVPVNPPADLTMQTMVANVTSKNWNYTLDSQVEVGYDGTDCYILGLLADFSYCWIKGTVDGDRITFPQGQFLDFFGEEGYSYEMYACGFDGSGRCDFVLERDAETGTLTAPSGMGIGEYMEYEGYFYDLDRLINISITPITDEAGETTFIPDGAERQSYYLSAEDFREGPVEYEAMLAFDADDVYLADFCTEAMLTGAAIKGYWSDDETIVFPSEQYIERTEEGYDIYFYGATYDYSTGLVTTGDLILDYDAASDTYHNRFTGILISVGKITTTEISFLEFLQDIVLMPAEGEADGIAPIATETTMPTAIYTLDGRRATTTKGITIKDGHVRINH